MVIFIAYMQPIALIPMALVGVVLGRIRRFYAPAVRDIKRLESLSKNFLKQSNEIIDEYLARSPIYSHLSSSIQGVPMIRSYGAQQTCTRDFSHCLNEHSRVYSVMLGMNRWTAMRIDCVVAAFVGILAFSMLLMHRSRSWNELIQSNEVLS